MDDDTMEKISKKAGYDQNYTSQPVEDIPTNKPPPQPAPTEDQF